jgi:MoaA/NifB/PqqE/SkfB family radical SAM enzyme
MDKEVSSVLDWITIGKAPPVVVELLFGDGCNQNCSFCYSHNGKKSPLGSFKLKEKLSEKDYLRIIDECGVLGVKRIQISGEGEPLYNKKTSMLIMKKIKKHKIYGFINTNGVLFNERDIKSLVNLGWDMILFSVEGPNSEIHDSLVNLPGAFDKVMHNVARFNYWKKKLKKKTPDMEFKMILTNRNYDKIEEMVLLCQKLNVHFRLDSLIVFHEQGKKLMLTSKQRESFKNHLSKALELYKRFSKKNRLRFEVSDELYKDVFSKLDRAINKKKDNSLKVFQLFKTKRNKFLSSSCYFPWLRILIRTDGFTGPCGFCYTEDNVKNKSLNEIWTGQGYALIRYERLNQIMGKDCSLCSDIQSNSFIRQKLNENLG